MDRRDIERIVREERDKTEADGLNYLLSRIDGITWLFILTLIQSAYLAYLLKSGFSFIVMFVLLALCLYFVPYLLAVIFPTALIFIMVILSLPSPSLVGPGAPTFSNYMSGIIEAFWLWLGLIVVSLFVVYRTRRLYS